ncbi:hypothetical protein [Terriglobus albidus]|uniref:hypothetical protein n=1 Tax=Terriglobus albidus TaxID=1592106 RepID=UPI0021E0FAC3|nr:hypothetical protein [Terriglobus albidus]
MAAKDAILFVAILLLSVRVFRKDFKWHWIDTCACGYMALLAVYVFVPDWLHLDVPFPVRLITYRAQTALVMFYLWGRFTRLRWSQWKSIAIFQIVMLAAASVFGIFERFMLPLSFWSRTIGVSDYLLDVKKLDSNLNVQDGLPSNLFHFGLRRLLSVYADPLGMGTACVFPLVAAIAIMLCLRRERDPDRMKWIPYYLWAATLIAIALLLTIGRESIGVACVAILVLCIALGETRFLRALGVLAFLSILINPSVTKFIVDTVTFQESSAIAHLNLLSTGLQDLSTLLVGHGVGTTGAWATSLGVHELTDIGESSYLELAAQGGAATLVVFLAFLIGLSRWLWMTARRCDDPVWKGMFLAISTSLIARLIFAVFSPSFFALIPMANMFFLAGAALSTVNRISFEPESVLVEESTETELEVYA